MKNKIIVCVLVFALVQSLCGCRLALPEGAENQTKDRLIGCYITTEYIDLFDFESYFNDNANKLVSGGNITPEGDSAAYQGRLYAEYYEETLHHEDGTEFTTGGYRFPGLEGISCFAPLVTEPDGSSYTTFMTSEGIHKLHQELKSSDTENYYTAMSGTVYAPVDTENELTGKEICFYMNPVYQAADGSVYLMSGNGMAMNSDSAGVIMSQTISEEYTTTVNGEEKTGGGSVEISYETAYVPELLRVIEMDGGGKVLRVSEFAPDELPESLKPSDGCSYMITEAVSYSYDGSEQLSRSIIEPEGKEKDLYLLTVGESGWLVNDYCEVLWEE